MYDGLPAGFWAIPDSTSKTHWEDDSDRAKV
jgi:hypothetical protein